MNGSMITTISIAAVDKPRCAFARKKIGTPTAAAMEKQMSCRLVRLNMTFVLTRLRSFGTGTNAIDCFLLSKSNAAFDLVAPNVPAFGRLTGKKLYAGKVSHEPNNAFPRLIRLFGMLFDVAEDDLTHTGVNSLRMSLRGKDADFRVCPCPIPLSLIHI